MKTEAYTAEAICVSLGIPSFIGDPACLRAKCALRLLLKPSFHPEICLTFADEKVLVVCARGMVWRQLEPAPMLTDRAEGVVSAEARRSLIERAAAVANLERFPSMFVDGMPSEFLLFHDGSLTLRGEGNAGRVGDFSRMVELAIVSAWNCISNVHSRNALADASEYVGKKLARESAPARKPVMETMILGVEEDRAQLIEALRTVEAGRK